MRATIAAVALLVLVAPAASAAPVDLFIHVNGFQNAPISPAEPGESYHETVGIGLATHSGCVKDPAGAQHFTDRQYHTWYAVQNAGTLDYEAGEKVRYHFQPGLLANVTLNDQQPVVHWFMAAEAVDGVGEAVVPNLVIEATLRLGSALSVDHTAFNAGARVGHGAIGPVNIYPGASPSGVTTHDVGGATVYGFTIPLDLETLTLPKESEDGRGFNLRIDAYVDNPLCSEGNIMPDVLKVHTSPGLRPRLSVDVADPIMINSLHTGPHGDGTMVFVEAMSPFAHADAVVTLETSLEVRLHDYDDGTYRGCHGHCPPQAPLWSFLVATEESGAYPLNITATNLQGTASQTLSMWLHVADGKATLCGDEACVAALASDKGAPGVPLFATIGALAAIALTRRR